MSTYKMLCFIRQKVICLPNTSMLQCLSNKNGVEWFLTLPGNLKVIMETWNVLETARIVITGKK